MKKILFTAAITVSLLILFNCQSKAFQQSGTISVETSGETEVTADLIYFHVNITRFDKDAREAFRRHKEQENYLTNMLLKEEIDERHIFANPISISSIRRQQEGSRFETRQQVTIRLDDVTRFETMQIALIENGFVNFSGNFSSTKLDKAKDEALAKAVQEAKRQGEILAEAAGKRIAAIHSIQYGSAADTYPQMRGVSMAFEADTGSLLQFERTLPVRENVKVVFHLGSRD
jgi:uncharacterized protein